MKFPRFLPTRFRRRLRTKRLRAPLIWARHRSIRPADVFIASYPRSGNTWLRFLLYELITGCNAEFRTLEAAIPYVGDHCEASALLPCGGRLIKTHENYRKEYRKAIYLVRDPRDVLVSSYFYYKNSGMRSCDFHEFVMRFLKGQVHAFGEWTQHVQSWLESPRHIGAQLLLIRYEDLCRRPNFEIARSLEFLEMERDSLAIQEALDNNSVPKMREKEDCQRGRDEKMSEWGRFVRQGRVNAWTDLLKGSDLALVENYNLDMLHRLGYAPSHPRDVVPGCNCEEQSIACLGPEYLNSPTAFNITIPDSAVLPAASAGFAPTLSSATYAPFANLALLRGKSNTP